MRALKTNQPLFSALKPFISPSMAAVFIWTLGAYGVVANDILPYERVVLMTEEFRNFRRLMMTIPDGDALVPIVRSNPKTGEFEITVNPVDVQRYTSRKVIRKQGQYPLSIQISFPDSATIQLRGNTIPYQTLVSYHILQEDMFIFDIYAHMPLESVFREKTVGLTLYDNSNPGNRIPPSSKKVSREYSSSLLATDSLQARFWKAILFALIPFSILLILFGVRRTIRPTPPPKTKDIASHPEPTQPVETVNLSSSELSPSDLQELTEKVMEEKGVSYDEATLLLNLSGTSGERTL